MREADARTLGLALLGTGTAIGIWSAAGAVSKSLATPEEPDVRMRKAIVRSALLTGLFAAGVSLAYGKAGRAAAVATVTVGTGLWIWYAVALKTAQADRGDTDLTSAGG